MRGTQINIGNCSPSCCLSSQDENIHAETKMHETASPRERSKFPFQQVLWTLPLSLFLQGVVKFRFHLRGSWWWKFVPSFSACNKTEGHLVQMVIGHHLTGEEGPETIIKSHSKMAQPFTANNPLFQFLRTLSWAIGNRPQDFFRANFWRPADVGHSSKDTLGR